MDFLQLKTPFTMIIAGGSGCGKTTLVLNMIKHISHVADIPPRKIVIVYSQMQPLYEEIVKISPCVVEFVEGLSKDFKTEPGTLLILDDLQGGDSRQNIKIWFTVKSHHFNTSLIYLTQNIFDKHNDHRTISLNTHYIILFKNPRDASQVTHLAKQMFPGNTRLMVEAYKQATLIPHSYILIDLKQSTPDYARLRQDVILSGGLCKTYIFVDESSLDAERINLSLR